MPLKRATIGKPAARQTRVSTAASETISRHWESSPPSEADTQDRDTGELRQAVETLGGSSAVRKRQARILVGDWLAGDVPAGMRIRRMLEYGDGETRIALVEALPNAVPFEIVESALKGMGRSFLRGSAQAERRGWTVVTALLAAGIFVDLFIVAYGASHFEVANQIPIAVTLATAPGLAAWQVMCVNRRIQMAIDTARQQQYFSRVAVIARTSLQTDPTQYAQPVLHRLEEMAPVVELEGGNTKKVYRQTVRVYQEAMAHLRSLPIAAESASLGPESLPVPASSKPVE